MARIGNIDLATSRFGLFSRDRVAEPVLFVRDRPDGACCRGAVRPESFVACMAAIFDAPWFEVAVQCGGTGRPEAARQSETDWVVGCELIRHGNAARAASRRAVAAAPSVKRLALLTAACLPMSRVGPFRAHAVPGASLKERWGFTLDPTKRRCLLIPPRGEPLNHSFP